MSATTPPDPQAAPTDWHAEIEKDRAYIRNLISESDKFQAEQRKLIAESQKLDRDRYFAPWLAFAAVAGGTLGLATFIARIFFGH